MQKSNDSIRNFTKNQLSGNYGQGIVATIVPGLIVWVISMILGLITGGSFIISNIVSIGLAILTTFMVTKMSLNIASGSRSAGFDDCLSPSDRLGKVAIYVIAVQFLSVLITLPLNKLFFDSWILSESTISDFSSSIDPSAALGLLYGYIGTISLAAILLLFITYKIIYVPQILIDQGLSLSEAVNKSFQYTKGNFGRIIGMYFFFFGWYFLSMFTCGILLFYVIPYHTISAMNLYLEIKEENGDSTGRNYDNKPVEEDPFESDPFNRI